MRTALVALLLSLVLSSCAHVVKYDGCLNLLSVAGVSEMGRHAEAIFDSGGPPPSPFEGPPTRVAHLSFKIESDSILIGSLTAVDTLRHQSETWAFRTTQFKRIRSAPPAGSYAARLVPQGPFMDSGFTWIVFTLLDADGRYGTPSDNAWLVKGLDHFQLQEGLIPDNFYKIYLFGTALITPTRP